jgi:hypothetical protein
MVSIVVVTKKQIIMQGLFDLINEEAEQKEKEASVINEFPIAYQIRRTVKYSSGKTGYEILDTYTCDKEKGIMPIEKARKKASLLKNCYVIEISEKIVGNF